MLMFEEQKSENPASDFKEIIQDQIGARDNQPNLEEEKTMNQINKSKRFLQRKITCNKGHMLNFSQSVPEFLLKQLNKDQLINLSITCDNCEQEIPQNVSRL